MINPDMCSCCGEIWNRENLNNIPLGKHTLHLCPDCYEEYVSSQTDFEAICKEIKQAADRQFQIALSVADVTERYGHIQMESAYRHSLGIIDKHTETMRPATPEERQGIDDYIDSIAESMKDEDINFKVGWENVEPEEFPTFMSGRW